MISQELIKLLAKMRKKRASTEKDVQRRLYVNDGTITTSVHIHCTAQLVWQILSLYLIVFVFIGGFLQLYWFFAHKSIRCKEIEA